MSGLNKVAASVNFFGGIDKKTDPKQVIPGNMLEVENVVYTTPGRYDKRNGFSVLGAAPINAQGLATFNDELLLLNLTSVESFDPSAQSWIPKGPLTSVNFTLTPVISNQNMQTTQDMAIHSLGIHVVAWEDSSGGVRYNVIDTTTGNSVVINALLDINAATPKVVPLASLVMIFYSNTSTNQLVYQYISPNTPSTISAPTNIVAINSSTPFFDAAAGSTRVFLTYVDNGGNVALTYIDTHLFVPPSSVTLSATSPGPLTVFTDKTTNNVYISYYDGSAVNWAVYNNNLAELVAPAGVETIDNVHNITGSVDNAQGQLFYDIIDNETAASDSYIQTATISDYTLSSPSTLIKSLGLGTKAFIRGSSVFVCGLYDSGLGQVLTTTSGAPQNKYFLLTSDGHAVGKYLSEPNTAGSLPNKVSLPSVTSLDGTNFHVALLINIAITGFAFDLNEAVVMGILDFNGATQKQTLGNNLHIAAGSLLSMYDGANLVEHGFNLYPNQPQVIVGGSGGVLGPGVYEYVATYEWNDNSGQLHRSSPSTPITVDVSNVTPTPLTFTAVFSAGQTSMTVSSTSGLFPGQELTDSTTSGNLEAGTTITSISGSIVGIDPAALGDSDSSPGDTISTSDVLQPTVYLNTLRVTDKQGVNIVVYRTQDGGTTLFRVGSVANDPTQDQLTFVDNTSDNLIVNNEQLYTTTGEVPNIEIPATGVITTFQNRLISIPAENPYQVMYSKQTGRSSGSALLNPVNFDADLFYFNVDQRGGPITATSPLDDKLILFKPNSIFFVYGQGPAPNGTNNTFSDPQLITTDCGCVDPASVVVMPMGLMFKSSKGIYLLNRNLEAQYIGAPVATFNPFSVTSAQLIPNTTQVRFSLSGIANILVYDYFVDKWSVFTRLNAVDSVLYNDGYVYLDTNLNQVFQETPGSFTDNGEPIAIKLVTSWLSFSGFQGFQRVYRSLLIGDYYTPTSISVGVAHDFNPNQIQSALIPVTSLFSNSPYGTSTPYGLGGKYGALAAPEQMQYRIDLTRQKCEAIQITVQENPLTPYGQGISLSGLTFELGMKKGFYKIPAANQVS